MRIRPLLTALLLTSSCTWCQPSPPTPPPADSCSSPSSEFGLMTLEVGGASDGPFLVWPVDDTDALLTRGGQGANMVGLRIRISAAQPVECIAQKTWILDENGAEIARREEALKVYAAPDGTRVTKTLWMAPSGSGQQPGDTSFVHVLVGGQELVRKIMLRTEEELPSPLGVQASVLCDVDVPVLVGLDRPAGKGAVAVIESDKLTHRFTEVMFREGEATAMATLHPSSQPGGELHLHAFGVANDGTIGMGDAPLVSVMNLDNIEPGGTRIVEVQLGCAGASDTVVHVTSTPAGILQHVDTLTFHNGVTTQRLRIRAPQDFNQPVSVSLSSGNGVEVFATVGPARVVEPQSLDITEAYTFTREMQPGDANCDGFSGVTDTFVEFANSSSSPVRIDGLGLFSGDQKIGEFPAGSVLGSHERAVFMGGDSDVTATHPWCREVALAKVSGRAARIDSIPDIYTWSTISLRRGSTTLATFDASGIGYFGFNMNESRVAASPSPVLHRLAPGHAVDRLFTPADVEDGLGAN